MCSRNFLFTFLIFIPLFASANEDEAAAKDGAPKESTYSGKQDQNWELVQTEVTALKGKMEMQATVVQNLIAEKNSLTGQALQQKMEQIKAEHQKYERLVVEYNAKNEEFMTRYPERGLKEKRVYKRAKIKSLDTFEDDVTIRGRMNKLHNKVLKQYPRAFTDEKNKKESSVSSGQGKGASDDVTNAIKIKK
ncbi:MAG: hypothetical protein K0R29_1125 [Pseudobdellovibrio sp.]|jgi:hypothetical protein|nr:hypothetical protein [Pseudobdellovibrio sp.]